MPVNSLAKIKTFIQIASKNVKKMIFFFNNLPLPICLSLKNASEQELEKTIFIVYNGDLYLSEELSKTLLQEFSDQSGSKDNFNFNYLTSREVQMIQLPADGFLYQGLVTIYLYEFFNIYLYEVKIIVPLMPRGP